MATEIVATVQHCGGIIGKWTVVTGDLVVPGTDHDSMSVTELAWGFETRGRFGRNGQRQWTFSSLVEHQRWQSEWMGAFTGSAVDFAGVSFNLGIEW